MSVKTLRDYFDSLEVPGTAQTFIPSQFSTYECLSEYFKNPTVFDYDYKQKFANLLLQEQSETEYVGRTFNKLKSVCIRKKYEWDTLYSSIIQVYNPIWNVDGTETTEYSAEKRRIILVLLLIHLLPENVRVQLRILLSRTTALRKKRQERPHHRIIHM